ncbi:GIY-YIG nuclease family protein [Chryseobacterium gleum]|uniref:GIY-YIG nuclease family protein n=1 Tax=Chryseobacterium gleum TaxID=250 RepID=UPI00289ED19A|nr:GIY-YIG nuclease family protein [Chryseobacterium gleum]
MTHIERKKEIAIGILPKKGAENYNTVIKYLEKNSTPQHTEFAKKNWEKVNLSLQAQYSSSCNLTTEKNLRHFLLEFNSRAWHTGLWSMPTMFNIMESFFNYKKPEIYFELIEEENYYVTLFDFLEFITSDKFVLNGTILENTISENIIYNFEFNKDFEKITFKNSNDQIFIIKGVSMIRRECEITLSLITGKRKTETDFIDKNIYKDFKPANPEKVKIVEKIKNDLKNNELEFEYLDKDKSYIKTIIAIRLDLETQTIDSRYVAEETNMMFNIITDDLTIFVDNNGNFLSKKHEELFKNNIDKIFKYDAIYDLINYLIYLPHYFNINENYIKDEDIDTEYKKLIQNPLKKRKFKNTLGYKTAIKNIFYLDKKDILSPSKIILRDDLFKVQKSGYWKTLLPEEIGLDKKGKTIHGRTWVSQNSSWFEASENDLIIEEEQTILEGPNVGYIYILRNPVMGKNIFKIGLTKNEVNYRVEQLSKTSVPDKFYNAQEWLVKDCILAEKKIHNILQDYRIDPRREFFDVSYNKAIDIITKIVKEINEI